MHNIAHSKTAETGKAEAVADQTLSVRVSPNSYLTTVLLGVFFSGFFVYLEKDFWAAGLLVISLIILPALAFTDRIAFDGKRLKRTGILPRAWAWLNNFHFRLKLSDIEQIETQALRALKRGGNVLYRYRTSISGKNLKFVIASGGEEYRQMVRQILPRLSSNVLDSRSIELRDYLNEPKEVLMKAEFAHIPPAEVLEDSVKSFYKNGRKPENSSRETGKDPDKAAYLRRLANELRLSGYLLQALETFRRALLIDPRDNWLLFEFARCLNSYAAAEQDEKLLRKSFAMLRLAEKRAENDGELLARLGESYFQFGDWQRAQTAFQKSIEKVEESFRAARGMAEIALREGKIAHVIHNFSAANRHAKTPALRRWSQSEADYFSHLNNDEDYMELEIARINLLETLDRSKKTSLKIAFLGFPAIFIGLIFADQLISNIGWAVSSVALLIWFGIVLSINIFSARIPYEMVEEE